MTRPQNPELRRSGNIPAFEPDAVVSRLDARPRPDESGPSGPVPEGNRRGHHPDHDQDKPDLDAFAERFRHAPVPDESTNASAAQRNGNGLVGRKTAGAVAAAIAALAAVAVVVLRRRRRSR